MNAAVLERRVVTRPMPGPCPVISTGRLMLRPHRMSDAAMIAESLADFQVSRMLSRVPQPYDRQDALDWLAPRVSGDLNEWALAITTGDDVHIGVVGIELRHELWHLGYWLNRFYWGRGYMTEATGAVVERFFRRMPETTLHSGAFADNIASLRVQTKLGFNIVDACQLFSLSRNSMAPHIETVLDARNLRLSSRP
ncbi:GNAT family N-acetyltransferase [Rhizobium sp. LCM 4573]|uniref:GNAT family N-acetyltransferase n=1 Tax=Rhizobium sp. LCM 4573 TaxID=1848291 RepID=UPI0008DAEA88|nr:GNAT family N-acetyltransferase [Rhizobium sp. LCM 4573]OHV80729.1 GNAT family N-acetyltransferase [Rhizobium sp. LCM 4573]